LIFFGHIFGTD